MTICFDIGGSAIKAAIASPRGEIRPFARVATPLGDFEAFVAVLADLRRQGGAGAGDVIALSITGVVDPRSEIITCANIPCIDGRRLAPDLAERLGVQLGTAKSWVRRGLAQIGRCLSGGAEADWRELMAAQYAIGSLQGASRRGFERRRERDARYCHVADLWENRLALLTECLPDSGSASPEIWNRICQQIRRERIHMAHPLIWQWTTAALALVVITLAVLALR